MGNYGDSVPRKIEIDIHKQKLKTVISHKYLIGLIFDYNMKWDKHIKYIINKTKYLIYIFAKIKSILDTKTLLAIYYAFFHSLINYGIITWVRAYNNNITLLQKIQTRILKLISKNHCLINIPLNVNQLFMLETPLEIWRSKTKFSSKGFLKCFKIFTLNFVEDHSIILSEGNKVIILYSFKYLTPVQSRSFFRTSKPFTLHNIKHYPFHASPKYSFHTRIATNSSRPSAITSTHPGAKTYHAPDHTLSPVRNTSRNFKTSAKPAHNHHRERSSWNQRKTGRAG